MYIESIKLFNFRHFRHNLIVENFSPGINMFVGPNGSGKSSFFSAFELLTSQKLLDLKQEFSSEQILILPKRSKNYLLIQISFDNSRKYFPVKKKKIIVRRLINGKADKLWISKYDSETPRVYEFLYSNGLDLKSFFLFLNSRIQLNFKMSDAYERLKFFKKKSNFNLFSNYQIKIIFLFKKVMIIKKKLSNLLKLLIKEQKRVNRQKIMNIEKQKINLTRLLYGKFLSKFRKIYFKELSNRFSLRCPDVLIKIIDFKTKLNIFLENVVHLKTNLLSKDEFVKKFGKFLIFKNNFFSNMINIDKKKLIDKIENYFSFSRSTLSNLHWDKTIFNFFKKTNLNAFCSPGKYSNYNFTTAKNKFEKKISTSITFKIKSLGNQQQKILFFNSYFGNSLSEKRIKFFLDHYFDFSRKIFLIKQKIQRILDKFSYEENFVVKMLSNQETNLSKSFGEKITQSIRFASGILRKNKNYIKKVKGILLDLLAVYKYFEKPFEAFFWHYFPKLVITDKNIIPLINQELVAHKKTRLEFILNLNFKKKRFLDPKHPALLNFKSFIYSNENFLPVIKNLANNLFLCIEPNLADKLSKQFSVTTITIEGQIFYPNGIISKHFLNSGYSIVDKTVILKKERNLLNWITNFTNKFDFLDLKLNEVIEIKKKNEKIGSEIKNYFFLKKDISFLQENNEKRIFSTFSLKILTGYLDDVSFKKKLSFKFSGKIIKSFYRKFKFKEKKNKDFRQTEINEHLKNKNLLNYLKNSRSNIYKFTINKNFYEKNLNLKSFTTTTSRNNYGRFLCCLENFFNSNDSVLRMSRIRNQNYHFLIKKFIVIFKKLSSKKRNFYCFIQFGKRKIQFLKKKLVYLENTNKKIKKFLFPNNCTFEKKIKYYIFKLANFHDNIETNFKILYQIFDIVEAEKEIRLQKISRTFSNNFQKNLNSILSNGKSCLIWKEKRIQKVFKNEVLCKKICSGLKILIKFNTNDTFNLIENLSKGQFGLLILIFCVTLCLVTYKNIFFFDELDKNMDFFSQKLGLKLIKKTSSRGIQFFIITHQRGVADNGDKWFGISPSQKGCFVENISCLDSKKFLGLKP